MTRVVVDTNVVLSSVFWQGAPYELMSRGLNNEFELVTSPQIIDEVAEKLSVKFAYPEDQITVIVDVMMSLFHVVDTTSVFKHSRDANDDMVLACAVDGAADYLITGDKDLLVLNEFNGVKIIAAKEFLAILDKT